MIACHAGAGYHSSSLEAAYKRGASGSVGAPAASPCPCLHLLGQPETSEPAADPPTAPRRPRRGVPGRSGGTGRRRRRPRRGHRRHQTARGEWMGWEGAWMSSRGGGQRSRRGRFQRRPGSRWPNPPVPALRARVIAAVAPPCTAHAPAGQQPLQRGQRLKLLLQRGGRVRRQRDGRRRDVRRRGGGAGCGGTACRPRLQLLVAQMPGCHAGVLRVMLRALLLLRALSVQASKTQLRPPRCWRGRAASRYPTAACAPCE